MAVFRQIRLSFWEDIKVVDEFTPEDRYFMLYLMTNPHTNQVGCYGITIRQMEFETGYNKDTINKLIKRFTENLKVIKYCDETKEVLILNWHKYNWTKSPKVISCILKEFQTIKNSEFRCHIYELFIRYGYPIDTVCIDLGEKEEKEQEQKKEQKKEISPSDQNDLTNTLNKPNTSSNPISSNPNGQLFSTENQPKKQGENQYITVIEKLSSNSKIRAALQKYLAYRRKKGLTIEQWETIVTRFKNDTTEKCKSADEAVDAIEKCLMDGNMKLFYKEYGNQSYNQRPEQKKMSSQEDFDIFEESGLSVIRKKDRKKIMEQYAKNTPITSSEDEPNIIRRNIKR